MIQHRINHTSEKNSHAIQLQRRSYMNTNTERHWFPDKHNRHDIRVPNNSYPSRHKLLLIIYLTLFFFSIIKLRESGILWKLKNDHIHNATHCLKPFLSTSVSSKQRALRLEDFLGIFSLYTCGKNTVDLVFVENRKSFIQVLPNSFICQELPYIWSI